MRALALVLTGVLLAAGCGGDGGDRAWPATASMPDVLREEARAARDAAADFPPFLLNDEQAALAARRPVPDRPRAVYRRALVFLRGGRTDEAIALLSRGDTASWSREHAELLAVAHLRRGEEANCLAAGHAPEVCILPFRGGAVHADPEPARRAAVLLRRAAALDTTDLDARWLLNVAHHALGTYPEGVPPAFLIPGLDGAASGAAGVPRLQNTAPERGVADARLSGGVALDDFDGDGDLDLVTTSWGLDDPVRYAVNDGRGHFVDRTREAGLADITGGLNLVHGDLDNDGDLDVLVLRGAWLGERGRWPNSLLRNDGGTFSDVTFAAGLRTGRPTQTAALADVDGDGWLDVFVGNESHRGVDAPSELFLNNRDGTFRDVAEASGLRLSAFVKGAVWTDVDADGRPDLYASVLGGPNRLFLNRSEGGTVRFEEAPDAAGAAAPESSFPAAVFDWDQDGADDLFVAPYPPRGFSDGSGVAAGAALEALGRPHEGEATRLFRALGGAFSDVTAAAGLGAFAAPTMGLNVEDLDGDGWVDLYAGTGAPSFGALVPNRLLLGGPDGRFTDVTYASGTGHLQKGHAVSFGDVDGDLDPDLYVVTGGSYSADTSPNLLFENPWQDRGWVVLRLEGRRANRSAIGAHVAVHLREPGGTRRTLWRTVGAGGSFGSNSLQLEVGVGDAEVDRVEVAWPGSGTRSTFRGVTRGGRYRLVEGADAAEPFAIAVDAPAGSHPGGHGH